MRSASQVARFWSQVDFNGKYTWGYGFCWEWVNGSDVWNPQPRESYRLNVGPIPDGLFVCHHCDNPKCVRPSHLFLGTNDDNRQDSVRKKRHAHGERHGHAKLTDEQVEEIRRRYKRTSYHNSNARELAEEFGIHQEYLGLLIRNTYRKERTVERE
jgi:hypothetical protein